MLPERQYVDEFQLYPEEQQGVQFEVYTNNTKKHKKHRHLRKLSQRQKLVVCLALVFVMSLFYVSLEAKITQVGYEMTSLQAEISDVQEENDRLMVEVEKLSSPERIAKYATAGEGMVAVAENNILYADISTADSELDEVTEADSSLQNQKASENPVASFFAGLSESRSSASEPPK